MDFVSALSGRCNCKALSLTSRNGSTEIKQFLAKKEFENNRMNVYVRLDIYHANENALADPTVHIPSGGLRGLFAM